MKSISRFNFHGGEVHVNLMHSFAPEEIIIAHIRSSDDVMALLLATDAYRRRGTKYLSLVLPYVPYARQDRVMVEGEALSIKVFCDLINSQNYDSVEIWDPHSDVTPALLNNCTVVKQSFIVADNADIIFDGGSANNVLVSPDAGARKKTLELSKKMFGMPVVFADKNRNTMTGEITGTTISGEPSDWRQDNKHLIVDDICDGGFTFTEIAKVLEARGVSGDINLYVTHAILSKGVEPFNGLIKNIFTANCWLTTEQIEESNSKNETQIVVLRTRN